MATAAPEPESEEVEEPRIVEPELPPASAIERTAAEEDSPALSAMARLAAHPASTAASLQLRLAWAASVVVLVLAIAAAFAWRSEIVDAWPPSGRAYALFGLQSAAEAPR